MEETPLVSIVITSFNRLDDLKESIRRTSDISYPNIEVIVIDGGSTDGSAEYVGNLDKEKYESLVLGVDEGAYITVAKGMRHAKGKYIITIDDDCFLRPSVVSKTVEIFESNSNLALIGYGLRNPKNGPDEKEYWKPTEFGVGDYNFSNSYQTMNYGSASAFRK
ncbi:MAG: glycosyltransferase family 2 protein, partial [Planctomycetes bacterium]|nr:glycosyltransferase family 2 protein [Planctomycetota bacterium]